MIYKKKCKICGKEFETKYYQKKYCDNKHYFKCIICGKDFEVNNNVFNRSEKNWPKTCSRYCQDILAKQIRYKRYGSDLYNSKKAKETRFKRYGAYESEKSKEKRKDTTQKKYERNCNIDLEKAKQTKKDRYNDENYNNREKAKQTSLKIWGVDNPSKSEEVKQKIVNTNLEHWGVDYTFKTENNKIKSRKTRKEKYGDETFTNPDKANKTKLKRNNGVYQSQETTEKIRAKKKSLYGYTSWNMNKAKETNIDKFGSDVQKMDTVEKLTMLDDYCWRLAIRRSFWEKNKIYFPVGPDQIAVRGIKPDIARVDNNIMGYKKPLEFDSEHI